MNSVNAPHPLLPTIDRVHEASEITAFGKERSASFYEACHLYAQSLWQQGFPAKCILALNRALSCVLPADAPVLQRLPLPYRALAWLLMHRPAGQFIGNPTRHWQHLATRMVEPNKELRLWRAWACWYLAKEILPESEFPPDLKQIREEGIIEPTRDIISSQLPPEDKARWHEAVIWAKAELGRSERAVVESRIRRIGADELPTIQRLAQIIWPQVYPGIISQAQIDYMLTVWYHPSAMLREMETRGTWFALIEVVGHGSVGYVSFERYVGTDICFINKLYLRPWCRRDRVGA
jgi:hypothetical protein